MNIIESLVAEHLSIMLDDVFLSIKVTISETTMDVRLVNQLDATENIQFSIKLVDKYLTKTKLKNIVLKKYETFAECTIENKNTLKKVITQLQSLLESK